MSRKSQQKLDVKVKVEKKEEQSKPQSKVVPLKRALSVWKKKNIQKAMFLDDAEAVEIFVKRYIPSLEATQEEFDQLLQKF